MNPMKKILFILFISLVIAQDPNTDFLKSELNLAIDDINSKKFSSAISRIDNNDFSDSILLNHALILKMKALHGNGDLEKALSVRKSINLNTLESNLNTISML